MVKKTTPTAITLPNAIADPRSMFGLVKSAPPHQQMNMNQPPAVIPIAIAKGKRFAFTLSPPILRNRSLVR